MYTKLNIGGNRNLELIQAEGVNPSGAAIDPIFVNPRRITVVEHDTKVEEEMDFRYVPC